jgi:hypothetical protein
MPLTLLCCLHQRIFPGKEQTNKNRGQIAYGNVYFRRFCNSSFKRTQYI